MQPLSVVVITHNEEKNIRAALESAKWADEIVVLDSFSTDRTVEIARQYTDSVYQEEWRGFSRQKSRAVTLAKNDWVFILDADERITGPLADELRGLMQAGPGKDGYYCARRNHFSGREIRHGGWYPDYSIRLFDRRRGAFGDRSVHEAVILAGEAGYLKNPMLHYTYSGVSDYLGRMERYSTLAADELLKTGKRAGLLDLTIRPLLTFVKMFIIKQGFRDGMDGLELAVLYAFYTFSKYLKLRELQGRAGEKKKGR